MLASHPFTRRFLVLMLVLMLMLASKCDLIFEFSVLILHTIDFTLYQFQVSKVSLPYFFFF